MPCQAKKTSRNVLCFPGSTGQIRIFIPLGKGVKGRGRKRLRQHFYAALAMAIAVPAAAGGIERRQQNRQRAGEDRERSHTGPPASRGPFLKRPCTERVDAPLPARRPTEAYPQRYGEEGQRRRSGRSGPRMPGSEGMDLWRPASQGPRSRVPGSVAPRRAVPGWSGPPAPKRSGTIRT